MIYQGNLVKQPGVLKVKIIDATLTVSTALVGKMDPYVVVNFQGQEYRSKTHKDGDKNPKWGFEFEVNVTNYQETIQFEVKDDKILTDSLIGGASYKIGSLIKHAKVFQYIELCSKKTQQNTGHILIQTEFVEEKQMKKQAFLQGSQIQQQQPLSEIKKEGVFNNQQQQTKKHQEKSMNHPSNQTNDENQKPTYTYKEESHSSHYVKPAHGKPQYDEKNFSVEQNAFEQMGANNNPQILLKEKITKDDGIGGSTITMNERVFDQNQNKFLEQ